MVRWCSSALGYVCHRMSKGVREAPGKALIGELAAESGDKTEGAFGELQHCHMAVVIHHHSQSV